MATYFTDFSSDSTGELFNSSDWTELIGAGTWTATVTTDAGATGGQAVVVDDGGWGTDANACTYKFDGASATTGDIEVVARVKANTVTVFTGRPVGPALISSTDSTDRYEIHYGGTGDWALWWQNNGTEWSVIGSAADIFTPSADTYFWIRVGRSGSTIRAKVWADGSGEPGSWQMSGTDTNISSVVPGFCYELDSPTPYTMDVFGAGTAGDTAPTSGGGGSVYTPRSMLLGVG